MFAVNRAITLPSPPVLQEAAKWERAERSKKKPPVKGRAGELKADFLECTVQREYSVIWRGKTEPQSDS